MSFILKNEDLNGDGFAALWLQSDLAGEEGYVVTVGTDGAEKGKVTWESKEEKGEVPVSGGKTMLQLKKKGIYILSDGKEKFTVSVNPQISSLSDLRSCKKAAFYCELEKLERGSAFKRVSWIFIAGALWLLVFNYCWNFRSRK